MLCNPRRMGLDAQALSLLHAQVYGVHVSRFAGKTAPSEMVVSKQDAGISFQCNPDNAQRLIKLALSELADLQVHFLSCLQRYLQCGRLSACTVNLPQLLLRHTHTIRSSKSAIDCSCCSWSGCTVLLSLCIWSLFDHSIACPQTPVLKKYSPLAQLPKARMLSVSCRCSHAHVLKMPYALRRMGPQPKR